MAQEAKPREAKPKKCFVICPIGAEGSNQRKRSDDAMKHVFERALEPFGYKVTRADKISEPGMITQQIITHLLNDDLVIADMTDHNANVFYELAVRHATDKPVVHVIDAEQTIPFDVAVQRTIKMKLDLGGAEEAVSKIREQVQEIEAGGSGDTPLKLAAAVQKLGNDPTNEVLRQIVSSVSTLRADIDKLVSVFLTPSPLQQALSSGLSGIANPPSNVWSPYSPLGNLRNLAGETEGRGTGKLLSAMRKAEKKGQKNDPKG